MTAFAALLFWLSVLLPISAPNAAYLTVAEAVVQYWPEEVRQPAMCIGWRESSYNPKATGALGERGIMQILLDSSTVPLILSMGYTLDQMWEVGPNIHVASMMYRRSGLDPWAAQKGVCW